MNIGIKRLIVWLPAVALAVIVAVVVVGCGDNNGINSGNGFVVIGGQKWMKKNMDIEITGSWCYENSADSCAKYGRLYTWEAAMAVCPEGWRLPSRDDWDKLAEYVGGKKDVFWDDESSRDWLDAGKKLKSKNGWSEVEVGYNPIDGHQTVSGNGTDNYGFSALPGGLRAEDTDIFIWAGTSGNWWTAEERSEFGAWYRNMDYDDDFMEYSGNKEYGFSVRCVEDK